MILQIDVKITIKNFTAIPDEDLYSLKLERNFQKVIEESREKQTTEPSSIILICFGGSVMMTRKK